MDDHPTQPSQADVFAAMQAAHAVAEAGRIREAGLRDELAAERAATMQETIKRMEAEKAILEERNTTLKVTADAAKADAAKAEAARVAAEEAAVSGGSSSGGGASTAKALADAVAKATTEAAAQKSADEYTYPRGIALPVWPAFDSSVQFNENDPAYADGHVRALAWRKVWQAVKEHFESVRDEYAHSLYNAIMKVRVSPIADKNAAECAGHLFHDADGSKGIAASARAVLQLQHLREHDRPTAQLCAT